MNLPERIKIEVDDKQKTVFTEHYIKAKTAQLKDFGYGSITEDATRKQLELILSGAEQNQLSIIGMFMADEIVMEGKAKNDT